MNLWSLSTLGKGMISCLQAYHNHAGDKDLKQLITDLISQTKTEVQESDEVLKENGITPAPALPERPKVDVEDIPAGARFSDAEIGAALAVDSAAGLVACSQGIGSSIREDIGAMFAKFHGQRALLGTRILRLNKEKGWLVPPPLQMKDEPVPV